MAAGLYNITGSNAIERGACYSFTADINGSTGEYSLSGYSASGYINRKWDKFLESDWAVDILTPESGIVQFSLTASQTSQMSLSPLEYEIFLYPPESACPVRILYGDVDIVGGLE